MSPATDILPVADARTTWRTVGGLARAHRGLLVAGAFTLVVSTAAALLVPRLLGEIVDAVDAGRSTGDVDRLALMIVAATVVYGIGAGVGAYLVGKLGEQMLATLREQVVGRALDVPLADVEAAGTGDVVSRACGDVDTVSEATREAIPTVIAASLMIGLTIVGLAALDWRLALAGLAATPVQAWASRWYLRRSRPIYAAQRAAEGTRSEQLHSSVDGAATVRALRLQDPHMDRITRTSRTSMDWMMKAARARAWFASRLNLAELVGLGTVLVAGFLLVRNDTVTVGAATAAALYFHRLFDPIGELLYQLDKVQQAGAALARLVGITTMPAPAVATEAAPPTSATVELSGVRFSYRNGATGTDTPDTDTPGSGTTRSDSTGSNGDSTGSNGDSTGSDRPEPATRSTTPSTDVLHDVHVTVPAGERVALVGASGAGKTTIAKLLAGIHAPTAGGATIGDVPVADLDPSAPGPGGHGRTVALVSQEIHVFAGTLADDLRLADSEATDAALDAALTRVGATDWVAVLPDGLETVVGEGGHRLTPTQAQQVALARLILADPALAILDEATAEAGSAGARRLDAAADAAIAGRTSLVIAHRLPQATTADRIVVMDGGRVVETGTHTELLAGAGPYAALWAAWSTGRATDEGETSEAADPSPSGQSAGA